MKDEFNDCVAILRDPKSRKSVATPWKNIPSLRETRRTDSRFLKGKIIRKKTVDLFGKDALNYTLGATEAFLFDYFSDTRFYKYLEEQKKNISKWFTDIDMEVYLLCTLSSGIVTKDVIPCIIPSWFLEFVNKEFSIVDMNDYSSEYLFLRKFQRNFYTNFFDLPVVQEFFYARFEASFQGTLEADKKQDLEVLRKRSIEMKSKPKPSKKV